MHFAKAKGLLSQKNGMNVFRGCTHGCIYCDARSSCYQMKHPFEDVEVKENAPKLLEGALKRKRSKCMISTGSMCDPYIPAEKHLEITRACLRVIERFGFGASVLTKSDLVLRDLDLYLSIARKAKCVVQMTLTSIDDALSSRVEPNVCVTSKRIEALKTFRRNGIETAVWFTPILPFINDTPENVKGIVEACRDAGVDKIVYFGAGMTLREGNREYFYKALDREFSGLKEKYRQTFGGAYEILSPRAEELDRLFYSLCKTYSIEAKAGKIFDYLSSYQEKETVRQLSFQDFEK